MDYLVVRDSLFHFCSFRPEKILTPRFFFCLKSPSFGANLNIMRTTSTRGHSDQRVAPDIARSRLFGIREESKRDSESPLTSQDQSQRANRKFTEQLVPARAARFCPSESRSKNNVSGSDSLSESRSDQSTEEKRKFTEPLAPVGAPRFCPSESRSEPEGFRALSDKSRSESESKLEIQRAIGLNWST